MPSSYTIGTHYEAFARALVASGRYASVSEVLREGLRLMEERERMRAARLEALRTAIAEGLEGPFEPWDIEEIIAEAARRKPVDDAA